MNYRYFNFPWIFLIDALGALLSAIMLGFVLANLESVFGMPRPVLHFLAGIAGVFALYSFFCYRWLRKNWQPFLLAIAVSNLLYCCLTIALVFYYRQALTILGILYFVTEVIVVVILARKELNAVARTSTQ